MIMGAPLHKTREAILSTAAVLYAFRGPDAVSMRDIASAVSIKPATLYHHFKDKEDLIRSTMVSVFFERAICLQKVLSSPQPPLKRLQDFVSMFVDLLFDDRIFARLVFIDLFNENEERREYIVKTVFEPQFALLSQTIAECTGAARPGIAAASVISLIFGHYQIWDAMPHLTGGAADLRDPQSLSRYLNRVLAQALGVMAAEEGEPVASLEERPQ